MSNNNTSNDDQMFSDMQLAYELQNREYEIQQRLNRTNQQPSSSAAASVAATTQQVRATTGSKTTISKQSSRLPTETDGYCTRVTSDHMLYVACEVEGILVEMLVDSGAASSAISKGEMKRLNLQSKLNTRFAGKAIGCGSANVLGVVENVIVSIGHAEFRLFFLVLDTDNPLMILGLDQMRKFNCIIDLEENTLIFGGKGGVEVQFLPFHDTTPIIPDRQNECSIM